MYIVCIYTLALDYHHRLPSQSHSGLGVMLLKSAPGSWKLLLYVTKEGVPLPKYYSVVTYF